MKALCPDAADPIPADTARVVAPERLQQKHKAEGTQGSRPTITAEHSTAGKADQSRDDHTDQPSNHQLAGSG